MSSSLRAVALIFVCLTSVSPARGDGIPTDNASRQRGVSVALQVCSACHDIKYVKYRHLKALGFSDEELDSLRGDHALSDPLLSLMPAADRKEMYGLVPPDLSLMAEARRGKAQYIYDVLTAFYVTADGSIDNLVFPGIRMPDILGISTAAGDPELRKELEGQARDVAAFLAWAADPSVDERHRLAPYVLGYLALITLLLYLLKRRIWARFHGKPVEFE